MSVYSTLSMYGYGPGDTEWMQNGVAIAVRRKLVGSVVPRALEVGGERGGSAWMSVDRSGTSCYCFL